MWLHTLLSRIDIPHVHIVKVFNLKKLIDYYARYGIKLNV